MSYTSVGRNKVYASIEDLPQNQKLVNGDRILIQTEDGTALVDYENIKIDLAHTTFSTQITNLIEFTSTVESFIDVMEGEFNAIQDQTLLLKNSVVELEQQMECCKLLLKFIMGYVNNSETNHIQSIIDNSLSGAGITMYEQCMNAAKEKTPNFSFKNWNLLIQ